MLIVKKRLEERNSLKVDKLLLSSYIPYLSSEEQVKKLKK